MREHGEVLPVRGAIEVLRRGAEDEPALRQLITVFEGLPLAADLQIEAGSDRLVLRLGEAARARLGPAHDTLGVAERMATLGNGAAADTGDAGHRALAREILLAWLLDPAPR